MEYRNDRVCLSVYLSVCLSAHEIPPNVTKFSVLFARGIGRLRWFCDTLCTSGFVDDVIFPIMGPIAHVTHGSKRLARMQHEFDTAEYTQADSPDRGRNVLSTRLPCSISQSVVGLLNSWQTATAEQHTQYKTLHNKTEADTRKVREAVIHIDTS